MNTEFEALVAKGLAGTLTMDEALGARWNKEQRALLLSYFGNAITPSVQDELDALDLAKLNKSGGNMTGTFSLSDLVKIQWLDQLGAASGAEIYMWEDHDAYGGELIIGAPWRMALIPNGPLQVFANDALRMPRVMIMSSGYASNANAAVNYMPSAALDFQSSVWTGSASVRNRHIFQSKHLDTTGTNSVLEIFDEASVTGENGGADGYNSSTGAVTGNKIAKIYRDGIWHPGSAPAFESLADGATITWTMSEFLSVQSATVTLGGNRTLALSGLVNGMRGTLYVAQDGTGSRTLALPSGSAVASGFALSTTAYAVDRLQFEYDGTNIYWTIDKGLLISLDSEVQTFVTAGSIADVPTQYIVNNLVLGLKTDGIWPLIHRMYPFVGGTALAHSIDLKGAGNITNSGAWTSGVTHDANGITGNGTTGLGDTNFKFSDIGSSINNAFAYTYCKTTTPLTGRYLFGATGTDSSRVGLYRSSANIALAGMNANSLAGSQSVSSDFRKHFFQSRSSSVNTEWGNNSTTATETVTSLSACDRNIYLLCRNQNGTADNFSDANLAMAIFGQALNSTQRAQLRARVDAFQTALGRANP